MLRYLVEVQIEVEIDEEASLTEAVELLENYLDDVDPIIRHCVFSAKQIDEDDDE